MDIKNRRFEMRLSEKELTALEKLAKHDGVTSKAEWLTNQIRRQAKRKKVW